jgi:hypothetical protein
MSTECAISIQEISAYDSIVARRWHAADFFNSIDPEPPSAARRFRNAPKAN